MNRALVLALLSALALPSLARADERAPRRVLVLDLERVGAVSEADAQTLTTMVASAISRHDELSVVSGEDIRRMLALEGEKQNLGCDGEASCLAELAGALAAEWIVFGQVSTLGDELVVSLTLFDAGRVEAVNRTSVRAPMSRIGSGVERSALSLVGAEPPPWALIGGVTGAVAGALLFGGAVAVGLAGASALEDASSLTSDEYRQVQLGTLAGAAALSVLAVASLGAGGWLLYVAASE